jgi:ketosteroid isomerase-like protein
MSGGNRATAVQFHEAYNDVDLERVYDLLHPAVEVWGHDGRVSHGPDEAVASMLGWRREWRSFVAELEEFTDLGDDRALVVVHSKGIGQRSGVEIEMHGSEIWTFRDGQVSRIVLYRTREDALEAARLGVTRRHEAQVRGVEHAHRAQVGRHDGAVR